MTLLLHQIVIFIFVATYVPIGLAYYIFMLKERRWLNRLCCGIIGTALLFNLPNAIRQYQQHIMGHFSGLPEGITTIQFTADIIFLTIFIAVISMYTHVLIVHRR